MTSLIPWFAAACIWLGLVLAAVALQVWWGPKAAAERHAAEQARLEVARQHAARRQEAKRLDAAREEAKRQEANRLRAARREAVRVARLRADAHATRLLGYCNDAKADLAGRAVGEFLPQSVAEAWVADRSRIVGKLRAAAQAPVSPSIYRKLRARIAFLEDPREFVDGFNRAFVARRLEQDAEWFDSVQPNPLTREQRLGIVRDEDTNLLVAGAGAGKTSTMVGKVAYLLRHGLARPSEILVLAFAEKAAEELTERLSTTLADPVQATTFHAFGLGLIARVEDKKLSLSALAQDKRALSKFIADRVGRLLSDRERRGDVVRFFTDLLHEGDPAEEAKTPDEFYRRQRDIGLNAMRFEGADAALRTLSDVRVKSLQEVKIGNWLTLEGIDWEYERKYEHPTADREHRQYEPDFYLPKYKIYLEHFGVGRDGRTAPGVDAQKYRASMRWKRELHQRFETTLVESYSYDFTEGKFPGRLYRQLKRRGVERRLLTEQEIAALVHARNKGFSPLVKLLNDLS